MDYDMTVLVQDIKLTHFVSEYRKLTLEKNPMGYFLNTRFRYKKGGPGGSHVQLSFKRRRVNISFFVE